MMKEEFVKILNELKLDDRPLFEESFNFVQDKQVCLIDAVRQSGKSMFSIAYAICRAMTCAKSITCIITPRESYNNYIHSIVNESELNLTRTTRGLYCDNGSDILINPTLKRLHGIKDLLIIFDETYYNKDRLNIEILQRQLMLRNKMIIIGTAPSNMDLYWNNGIDVIRYLLNAGIPTLQAPTKPNSLYAIYEHYNQYDQYGFESLYGTLKSKGYNYGS